LSIEHINYYHFVKEFYINMIDIQFCYRYYLLIYKYWHRLCSLWQIHIRYTTGVTSGAGTTYPSGAPEFTPVFSGVHVTRSLVLYVYFVDRCLSFCTFSFGHCVVCSSSIYGFWLPLWYLRPLLVVDISIPWNYIFVV
jgi:hypothetical protein